MYHARPINYASGGSNANAISLAIDGPLCNGVLKRHRIPRVHRHVMPPGIMIGFGAYIRSMQAYMYVHAYDVQCRPYALYHSSMFTHAATLSTIFI